MNVSSDVSRVRGTHRCSCSLLTPFFRRRFRLALLKQAEQALRDVRDVRREAGRGEVESEHDAGNRVPQAKARVPAQHENYQAQGEHD